MRGFLIVLAAVASCWGTAGAAPTTPNVEAEQLPLATRGARMQNQLRSMGFGGAVTQPPPAPAEEARSGSGVARTAPSAPVASSICLGPDCTSHGVPSEVSLRLAEPVMPAALPAMIRMQLPNIARLSVGEINLGWSSDLFGSIATGSTDQIFEGAMQFNAGWPTLGSGRSRSILGGANPYESGERDERESAVDRVLGGDAQRRDDDGGSDHDSWRADFERSSARLGDAEFIFSSGDTSYDSGFARTIARLLDPRNYSLGELFLMAIPVLLVFGFMSMLSSSRR